MSKNTAIPLLLLLCCTSHGQAQLGQTITLSPKQSMAHGLFTHNSKASALEKAWQKAKTDEQREAVQAKAKEYLDRQFEADMERREKELEEIEARVEKLRGQLEKRVEKKSDIIGLQLKQMTMSWEGLGWSEPVEQNSFAVAWAPQPPMPPSAPSVASGSFGPGNLFNSKLDNVLEEVVAAADAGDQDELRRLASKVAENSEEMDPVAANDVVWRIYEKVGDDVKDEKFWLTLAKTTEDAADGVDQPVTLGNILDTSAHCYYLGGDYETAIKLQARAVEASAEAHDGEADDAIAGFLKKLKKISNEKNSRSTR